MLPQTSCTVCTYSTHIAVVKRQRWPRISILQRQSFVCCPQALEYIRHVVSKAQRQLLRSLHLACVAVERLRYEATSLTL